MVEVPFVHRDHEAIGPQETVANIDAVARHTQEVCPIGIVVSPVETVERKSSERRERVLEPALGGR